MLNWQALRLTLIRRFAPPSPASGRRGCSRGRRPRLQRRWKPRHPLSRLRERDGVRVTLGASLVPLLQERALILPQEIIRKKRDGLSLSAAEIVAFIEGLTSG